MTAYRDTKRPKGFKDWSPRAETQVVLAQVQSILDEYRKYLPMTARQIFYRMVGKYDFEKTEKAYNRLCEYLVRARRAQMIPFGAIRDDSGTAMGRTGYDSLDQWWDDLPDVARGFTRNRTEGQPVICELWCEAEGMAPQLARVARDYDVSVYSTGGFSSVTVTHQIARRAAKRNVSTVFLHIGDYDPSGQSIYESMTEDAWTFFNQSKHWDDAVEGIEFRYRRVALTEDQVDQYNLPTAPPKSSDSRSRNWLGDTCQAEAMPPDQLTALARQAIEDEFDMDQYYAILEEEEDDRAALVDEVEDIIANR